MSEPDLTEMVKAIAGLPADSRRVLMVGRLNEFYNMTEENRHMWMRAMLKGLHSLPVDKLGEMVLSRTQALWQLPEQARRTLLTTHLAVLEQLPTDVQTAEFKATAYAIQQLDETIKSIAIEFWRQMLAGMPEERRARIIGIFSEAGLRL